MTDNSPMNDAAFERAIEGVARDVQPGLDLWPSIEAELQAPLLAAVTTGPESSAETYWPIAATVLLVAMGALLFVQGLFESPDPGFQPLVAHELEIDALSDTRDALLASLAGATAGLSDADREDITASLEGLRSGREDVEAALEASPNDPFLQDMRVAMTYEELAMIQAIFEIANATQRT